MSGPNTIIENNGEDITHITVLVDTENGEETNRTESETETKAVVSSPSEEDLQQIEGRVNSTTYKLTVPSDLDVQLFRELDTPNLDQHYARDEFIVRDTRCEIASGGISKDTHPMTGTEKQTVIVQAKG